MTLSCCVLPLSVVNEIFSHANPESRALRRRAPLSPHPRLPPKRRQPCPHRLPAWARPRHRPQRQVRHRHPPSLTATTATGRTSGQRTHLAVSGIRFTTVMFAAFTCTQVVFCSSWASFAAPQRSALGVLDALCASWGKSCLFAALRVTVIATDLQSGDRFVDV